MDLSLIANIDNIVTSNQFLREQKEQLESVYNAGSPLNKAQQMSDSLMMSKQRKPMVIEYYKEKGKIESVEMYINPQRLNVSTQKVKSKAYTRGGIFYHHWGDDHWNMQLSGTVGLAGMKGIEQLEKIYHYSGTLLRYKDAGPTIVSGVQQEYEVINYEDPFAAFDYILANNVDEDIVEKIRQSVADTINNKANSGDRQLLSKAKSAQLALQLMQNYANLIKLAKNTSKYSNLYIDLNAYINKNNLKNQYTSFEKVYQEAQKRVKQTFSNYHPQLKVLIAFDLAKSLYGMDNSDISFNILSELGDTLDNYSYSNGSLYISNISNSQHDIAQARTNALKQYIKEVQEFNQQSILSQNDIYNGYSDIADEIEDEWRPRQVFIYFEDRVYIGHFDSFNWARVAENPLIQYDLKFTITRQIIVTSTQN